MSDASDMRTEAADIRRIAVGKLDWCDRDDTKKKYAGVPESLSSIRNAAESALRGAQRLDRYANVLEQREKAA